MEELIMLAVQALFNIILLNLSNLTTKIKIFPIWLPSTDLCPFISEKGTFLVSFTPMEEVSSTLLK
jgi:hypothetical protein